MNAATAIKSFRDKVSSDALGHVGQFNIWDPIEPNPDPVFTLRHLCAVVEHHGVEGLAQCQSPNGFLDYVIKLTAKGVASHELINQTRKQLEQIERRSVQQWLLYIELARLVYPVVVIVLFGLTLDLFLSPALLTPVILVCAATACWSALNGCPVCRSLHRVAEDRAHLARAHRLVLVEGVAGISSGLSWNALRRRLPPLPRRDGRFDNWQVAPPSLKAAFGHGQRAGLYSKAA